MGDTNITTQLLSSTEETATVLDPTVPTIHKAIYSIAIAQFIFGSLIAALNTLTLGATIFSRKMRTASYFLSSNLWFANLLLGVVVAVANVVDNDDVIALEKTEGTISVINTFATLITLIALCTARLVGVKAPHHRMGSAIALKIILISWLVIFALTLIKSIVYALFKMETIGVCYKCLLSFEAAIIIIFALVCIVLFILTIYTIHVYKKSTVQDSSNSNLTVQFDLVKETRETVTVGLWVLIFLIPCFAYVFTLAAFTVSKTLDKVAVEATVLIFYIHCLLNPIICIIRDADVRKNVKKIIRCSRLDEEVRQVQALQPATEANGISRVVTPPSVSASGRLPPLNRAAPFGNPDHPPQSVRSNVSQKDTVRSGQPDPDSQKDLKLLSIDDDDDDNNEDKEDDINTKNDSFNQANTFDADSKESNEKFGKILKNDESEPV